MYDRNTEKPWSAADTKMFRELIKENTPTRVIGLKLGRTEDSVYGKAKQMGVSLKPTNQPPNLGRNAGRSSGSRSSGGRSTGGRNTKLKSSRR